MNLDLEEIRSMLVANLPLQVRWWVGDNPFDYNFSAARRPLEPLPTEFLEGNVEDCSDLLVFGEDSYAEGGGASAWLCISRTEGAVYRFSPEADSPRILLNSSAERFIRTFRILSEAVGEGGRYPSDLPHRLEESDPEAYPISDWRDLVDLLESNAKNRDAR